MSNVDFDDQDTPDAEHEVEENVVDEPADEDVEAEGEDDVEASAEDDGQEAVVEERPRQGRRDARINTLLTRAEEEMKARVEAQAKAERLDRELMELRQRTQHQESAAQRAERLALMTPEERSEARLNEAMEANRRELAAMQFKVEDQTDRAAFHAKASIDPLYGKWAEKVEAKRLEFLRQGTVVPREELLKWMVGESVIANRGKSAAKQARQGQDNIRRQTTRAVNGKADTASQRQRAADSPAKRLEGVPI